MSLWKESFPQPLTDKERRRHLSLQTTWLSGGGNVSTSCLPFGNRQDEKEPSWTRGSPPKKGFISGPHWRRHGMRQTRRLWGANVVPPGQVIIFYKNPWKAVINSILFGGDESKEMQIFAKAKWKSGCSRGDKRDIFHTKCAMSAHSKERFTVELSCTVIVARMLTPNCNTIMSW